uniref:guanine nucleotide-binding protein G(I)/G(S)/G(O) subunit gamma-2 isoform X1 n=1 Tax=Gasterosteus aculeatus aculeatus TaxID=481459 RepID=UPI001A98E4CE|nr:guanine nucleotide-binding protein G(I)/G(S)/G(O) subunit gamma-2 isoform X1 [Gasterosteus aculeatus aculeatus]
MCFGIPARGRAYDQTGLLYPQEVKSSSRPSQVSILATSSSDSTPKSSGPGSTSYERESLTARMKSLSRLWAKQLVGYKVLTEQQTDTRAECGGASRRGRTPRT